MSNLQLAALTRKVASRIKRQTWGVVVVCCSVLLVLAIVLAPLLCRYDPTQIVGPARTAPNGQFLFGTDNVGRDVFARTLYGGQKTLFIAFTSMFFAAAVGILIGIIAGYFGRATATILMRFIDILMAFPGMLLALVVVAIAGANVTSTIVAVAIAHIPTFARMLYGSTLRVKSQEYIEAAEVIGCSPARIMLRHMLPSLGIEIIVLMSSAIAWTTLLAAALSFLGFGVAPPTPEWGSDLGVGGAYLSQAAWISFAPGIAITVTILLSNFLGDVLARLLRRASESVQAEELPTIEQLKVVEK